MNVIVIFLNQGANTDTMERMASEAVQAVEMSSINWQN